MLRLFEHPVACCCMLLGVVASVCTPPPTWTQQHPTLLANSVGAVASVCTPLPTWTQQHPTLLANSVGGCCVRLHTAANMDATTPNIVGQQCWGLLRPFVGSLREYQKVLLVESGIPRFRIPNTGQAIRNPTYDWNPESRLQ